MTSNILIVDDDKRLRELLEGYLTKKKYNVYLSDDFTSAKNILDYFIFDLIIIDRMMPSGDGIDLIKIIKGRHSMVTTNTLIQFSNLGIFQNRNEGVLL